MKICHRVAKKTYSKLNLSQKENSGLKQMKMTPGYSNLQRMVKHQSDHQLSKLSPPETYKIEEETHTQDFAFVSH